MHLFLTDEDGCLVLFVVPVGDDPLPADKMPKPVDFHCGIAVLDDHAAVPGLQTGIGMEMKIFIHPMGSLADHILGRKPDAAVQVKDPAPDLIGLSVGQRTVEAHFHIMGITQMPVVIFESFVVAMVAPGAVGLTAGIAIEDADIVGKGLFQQRPHVQLQQ